jgi:hypothetical protein
MTPRKKLYDAYMSGWLNAVSDIDNIYKKCNTYSGGEAFYYDNGYAYGKRSVKEAKEGIREFLGYKNGKANNADKK